MIIENLVFEGGGVKGIAYLGAIKALESEGILKNVKRVAGSSIGGITAFMVGLGLNASEIEQELKRFKFTSFQDTDSPFWSEVLKTKQIGQSINSISDMTQNLTKIADTAPAIIDALPYIGSAIAGVKLTSSLLKTGGQAFSAMETIEKGMRFYNNSNFGIYKGEHFEGWAKMMLAKHLGSAYTEITFRQLKQFTQINPNIKEMSFTGTNLSKGEGELEFFNAENEKFADMPIWKALRITMAFPGIFEVVRMNDPITGEEHIWSDGGIKNNFPLEIYDIVEYIVAEDEITSKLTNPRTLGIKIDSVAQINRDTTKIDSPLGFGKRLVQTLLNDAEKIDKYKNNIIQLPDLGIGTLDFEIDQISEDKLINKAEELTKNWLNKHPELNQTTSASLENLSLIHLEKLSAVKLLTLRKNIIDQLEQMAIQSNLTREEKFKRGDLEQNLANIEAAYKEKKPKGKILFTSSESDRKIKKAKERAEYRDLVKQAIPDEEISPSYQARGSLSPESSIENQSFFIVQKSLNVCQIRLKTTEEILSKYDSVIEHSNNIIKNTLSSQKTLTNLLNNPKVYEYLDQMLSKAKTLQNEVILLEENFYFREITRENYNNSLYQLNSNRKKLSHEIYSTTQKLQR
ncbi:MAG: patatin-like phospholipase, partial [Francisellaceae bacterium]|nr:patatin-like phospholipase [Francisellaceae bacterium]